MSLRNWFKFIFLAIIWGTSFFWIRVAVRDVSPFVLVLLRVSFALLGMVLLMAFRRRVMPNGWRWLGIFAFLGFFNVAFPFVIISWAEQYITSGLTSILNSTVPLFTFILASLFLPAEKMGPVRIAGLVLGFVGVVVLMADKLGGGLSNSLLGSLGVLLATFCYATSTIFARRFANGLDGQTTAMGQIGMSFLFILPATFALDSPVTLPELPITWFALAWMGLLSSAAATVIFFSLMNTLGPTRVSMVGYLIPLTAVGLGILVLGEEANWNMLLGAVMVIGGVWLVNSKVKEPISEPMV